MTDLSFCKKANASLLDRGTETSVGVKRIEDIRPIIGKADKLWFGGEETPAVKTEGEEWFLEFLYRPKKGIIFSGNLERVRIPLDVKTKEEAVAEARRQFSEMEKDPLRKGRYDVELLMKVQFH